MTPIDIRPDHLRIVREVLQRHLPAGVKVWVFGSRASWATKDSSDLDLALDGDAPIPRRRLSALEAAFVDSDLPYTVDVVDLKRIGERFRRIVTKQRAPLPESECPRSTDESNGPRFDAEAALGTRPNRRLHLPSRHRAQIEALLREHLPGVEVWAYGSRVRGESHDGSDLDLVLRAPGLERVPMDPLCDLWEALGESTIPFLVEARDWARLPKSFYGEIERDYVVLVEGARDCVQGTDRSTETPPPIEKGTRNRRRRCRWKEYAVRELLDSGTLEIGDGYRAKNSELSNSGLPFARAGNIKNGFQFDGTDRFPTENLDRVKNKASLPGDVVFTSKGTVGRFAYVRKDTPRFVYSPQLCFWRSLDRDLIDPRFLFCWMSGREFFEQFKEVSGQTDMAEFVSLRDQRNMRITLPPISEQRAIAHILGALDDRIELNRRMNETLEETARALFKSWFVDFDPVRAKMEGRDPGLPKDLADLFPDRLVDSELGPIPEGWSLGKLDDIAFLNPESWNARNAPDEIVYVDLANTKWGRIETVEVHSWSTAPSRARRVLRPGDTIVGTVRPGNGSYALIGGEGLTGSTGFAVLRPRISNAREIVWCAATSRENIDRLAHLADGGAYPAVRPHTVAETHIVLSDASVRRAFSSMTAECFDRMENNKRASRKLATLRDALLAPLVSGESQVWTTAA